MTNKDQVGETVWFYSRNLSRVINAKIYRLDVRYLHRLYVISGLEIFPLLRRDAYDTKAEAVEALRVWAEEGIKNLQTILDNLKDDQ